MRAVLGAWGCFGGMDHGMRGKEGSGGTEMPFAAVEYAKRFVGDGSDRSAPRERGMGIRNTRADAAFARARCLGASVHKYSQ